MNQFAEWAEKLEQSLGLGQEKTTVFLNALAKQVGPYLSQLEQALGSGATLDWKSLLQTAQAHLEEMAVEKGISKESLREVKEAFQILWRDWFQPQLFQETLFKVVQVYFLQKATESTVDDFGMDPKVVEAVRPLFQFLYKDYWRVSVHGGKNIPAKGRGLIVGNHSGMLPYDASMIHMAVYNEHSVKRLVRFLVEDFVYHFPFLGTFIHRIGGVRACPENATWLLKKENLVIVFPEGVKGLGKSYEDRYQLQRFGRGGFVRLAIRTKTPIIPCAVIGAEEIHPILWKSQILAKSMGIPYLPVTPTFPLLGPVGLIPFPTKWEIIFGKPISFSKYKPKDAEDDLLVHTLAEKVRTQIQGMVNKAIKKRTSLWFG